MAQRVKLLDSTGMKQVISRLMDHFGIRYTSPILEEVPLLQHFVNIAMNVNGFPSNPDNPDGLPFRKIHFLREPEILEEEQTSIGQEVIIEEQIEINHRTKTETKKSRRTERQTVVITKKTFKE